MYQAVATLVTYHALLRTSLSQRYGMYRETMSREKIENGICRVAVVNVELRWPSPIAVQSMKEQVL